MKHKKLEILGIMDFHGSVDITDPCYSRDSFERMNDVKIKEGNYTGIVRYRTFENNYGGSPYSLPSTIGIYLDGIVPVETDMEWIGNIGVDAGLAGFFHHKPDYNRAAWTEFCSRISSGDAWMIENGFCSRSGDGDGAYGVFAYQQDGEICALEIRFL